MVRNLPWDEGHDVLDARSRPCRRTAGALAVLLLLASVAACGGGDDPKADAGERNAAAFKKDVSVMVVNNREQPLAVVGVATSRNEGEILVSQYSRIQYVSGYNADTVEFTVKLPTGDLQVVGRNPYTGDPTITINDKVESFPTGTSWKWVYSEAGPRIVVERKPDTSGLQNFEFWVGW